MNYEEAYKELKKFCETLYDGIYCPTCGHETDEQCEDCHRKMMMWTFPKNVIEKIDEKLK